ncbi:MAG: hypothetical protein JW941_03010 [Candidatus Coatesbacteria bacterium]|nr:hypothetical protein [Candidatus Coatesbacteria bacterium]
MKIRITILIIALLVLASWAAADKIIVEFTAGDYTIEDVENGEIISMGGFGQGGSPGAPMLPTRTYYVALPPDVVWDSIAASVIEKSETTLPSVYDIAPNPPMIDPKDGRNEKMWGDATNIVDGKDLDIYSSDTFIPADPASVLGTSQMRKWKYVEVAYQPFNWNPVTRELRFCDGISLNIKYEREPDSFDAELLADTVMDGKASQKFINFGEAREWYTTSSRFVPLDDTFNYVIITTEAIYDTSGGGSYTSIEALKTHLTNIGYSVLIVTERNSYGDGGAAGGYGSANAEDIRGWLIDNYAAPPRGYGIELVLLIGNPNPDNGDVPMKECIPGTYYQSGGNYYYYVIPTDYYYADLTGDWDSSGDGYYGMYGYDNVDFDPEVYVARIPVYDQAYSTLDSIIEKEIAYDTASGDLNWRKRTLFPLSFPWDGTDPSHYSHCMKTQYMNSRGFDYYEMYQDGHATYCSSDYAWDEVLHGGPSGSGSVVERWKNHEYGLVWWFGHGNYNVTVVGNHDSTYDCYDGYLFLSSYCGDLDDSHPAFTFQISCLNGSPYYSTNLGYSLLKNGAICTGSAAESSLGTYGHYDEYGCERKWGGSQDIGYWYAKYLTDDNYGTAGKYARCAEAFYDANAYLSGYDSDAAAWHNYYVYNLYGCPHTRLYDADTNTYIRLESFEAHARGRNIVLTWETGAEIDNAGFLLYRFDGEERKAISRLIPAEGSATSGASYRFVDSSVEAGKTYQYWLIDIDTNGTWTSHGPVRGSISSDSPRERIRNRLIERVNEGAALAR